MNATQKETLVWEKLHKNIQKWIYSQNWQSLRAIQEEAIPHILAANKDVIISAATASGKTEAAFLPALSHVLHKNLNGISILYISPLKALINDQYRRLESLYDMCDQNITPWHGDVAQSTKTKLQKKPADTLLITPESIEALLIHKSSWLRTAFSSLQFIIIDEFHAFSGSERGCQLQSVLHRIEVMVGRKIPRIALSATFRDEDQSKIVRSLRITGNFQHHFISSTASASDLKLLVKGFVNKENAEKNTDYLTPKELIIADLFDTLRGGSNLIFANSRSRTEEYCVHLSDLCKEKNVPNEFFAHHGSLSKDIRHYLEKRLQEQKLPTTALCTMTLELGIDIGNIDSIAQITPPFSVASLRQRLGRSGRRGKSAILRGYFTENEITPKSHPVDNLRLSLIQAIAVINLLLDKRYESEKENLFHFSTLLQQTLSVIAQHGSLHATQLFTLLCKEGAFQLINSELFILFLKDLHKNQLITQMDDDCITLGIKGERLVGHFTFYSAFLTPEEFRLEVGGKIIGSIPIDNPLAKNQHIIFAGKRWIVTNISLEKKIITLKHSKAGNPPNFSGESGVIDSIIRKEMKRILQDRDIPIYLDKEALSLFTEACDHFAKYNLDNVDIVSNKSNILIFFWAGDKVISTVLVLLVSKGFKATSYHGVIDVTGATLLQIQNVFKEIIETPPVSETELAGFIDDTVIDKHDHFLSKSLLDIGYGKRFFDISSMNHAIKNIKLNN